MPEKIAQGQGQPEQLNQSSQIVELSAVFTWKKRSFLFVGCDRLGRPLMTEDQSDLSDSAHDSFQNSRRAGHDIMQIPYTDVTPVVYQFIAGKVNYREISQGESRLVQLSVGDKSGKTQIITVSETALLSGIHQSSHNDAWENSVQIDAQSRGGETQVMYSVLVEDPDSSRSAYALLFDSGVQGATNEPAFTVFVQEVLKNLVKMEASQSSDYRKGYIQCANEFFKKRDSNTSPDAITTLLSATGFIKRKSDFQAGESDVGGLSGVLTSLFARKQENVEVDSALDDSITLQSRISTLAADLPALLALTEEFYELADRDSR